MRVDGHENKEKHRERELERVKLRREEFSPSSYFVVCIVSKLD